MYSGVLAEKDLQGYSRASSNDNRIRAIIQVQRTTLIARAEIRIVDPYLQL